MKTTITHRSNTNDLRSAVEAAFKAAGLVEIAGGTRNTYFGVRGQGTAGYCIRVGIRTFRRVKRVRLLTGLEDITVGKEHFHGKTDLGKVAVWVQQLVDACWFDRGVS